MATFENRCISDEDVTSVLWLVRSFSHSSDAAYDYTLKQFVNVVIVIQEKGNFLVVTTDYRLHKGHFDTVYDSAYVYDYRSTLGFNDYGASANLVALQTITQQVTGKHCLLFILQHIYSHNLSPHTSSQPITSRFYQRLVYLLTNQIAQFLNWR